MDKETVEFFERMDHSFDTQMETLASSLDSLAGSIERGLNNLAEAIVRHADETSKR